MKKLLHVFFVLLIYGSLAVAQTLGPRPGSGGGGSGTVTSVTCNGLTAITTSGSCDGGIGLSAAAAAGDTDTFVTNQGAANLKQTLAAVKTWIKSWIAKADVGLGNVANVDTTVASNIASGTLAPARLGSLIHPGYVSSNWYPPGGMGQPIGGATYVASTVYCHPWVVGSQGMTIKSLGVNVTTSSNGNNISIAIYRTDGTSFRPGSLVDSIGSTGINLTASTGAYSHAVANTTDALTGGVYWACTTADNTVVIFAAVSAAASSANSTYLVGSTSITAAASVSSADTTSVSCTAGTTCQGASFAWSGTTFTWPASLASSTWAEATGNRTAMVLFQAN